MPTSMFHLNVAKKIATMYQKYDTPNFYIGTIAPDAVNLNGFAEKKVRYAAHRRMTDLETWKLSILSFYNIERNDYFADFIKGYIIHILTDLFMDEIYYNDGMLEDIVKNRATEDEAFSFWKDQIIIYENSQLNEEWWKDVKNKLNEAKSYEINDIPKVQISKWRDKVLLDYEKRAQEPYDYITPDTVNNCVEKVLKFLRDNGISLA